MGAWGIHTFESDSSLDWIAGFQDDPTESKILNAFTPQSTGRATGVFPKLFSRKPQSGWEELDGEDVLGAAEVVAALMGRPSPYSRGMLDNLPNITLSPDTPARAIAAIDTILANSNLKDCWEETDIYEQWVADVREIQDRLRDPPAEQDAARTWRP